MSNDPPSTAEQEFIEVRCYFVRNRNALVVRGEFSEIYTDYYLHLMEHGLKNESESDQLLKDGLAALALYLASRPRNEAVAWTLNWQSPLLNLFLTGSNRDGSVTGRIFTGDSVKKRDENLFYSQTTVEGQPSRQSMVEAESMDMFAIAETFFKQSEQRPARFFRHDEENFVLVSAQPDCDMEWFNSLSDESIRTLDQTEELSLLEKRVYCFRCGCSMERIFPLIGSMSKSTVDDVFGGGELAKMSCPRCGANYIITREALEAWEAEQD